MKKAGMLAAASVAAASSSVVLSSGHDARSLPHNEGSSSPRSEKESGSGSRRDGEGDKFAPRFDGLRFIETLVTAHR